MASTYTSIHLSYEEQLNKFIERGMQVKSKEYCIKKLENINYYKLKEFAIPYSKEENDNLIYENIFLEQVIKRFYLDKNLRIHFLHAIEKIEISLKNKIAYVLGERLGAFGYTIFKDWCDKDKYCKYYIKIQEEKFKSEVSKKLKRTANPFIREFLKKHPSEANLPIWLLIEILTFGEILEIYRLMTKTNRIKIAKFYNATTDELDSWLTHLKLIRNMCAHNSGIIDIKFKTVPKIRDEWKKNLFSFDNGKPTNRIGISLVILKFLLYQINPDYHFGDIAKTLQKLMKAKSSNPALYGLVDKNVNFLFEML